ncbi:MAG: thioredoxin family protein [Bacteroidetes bacterium]|nr:thioredoxin family protein [Bacteroidota bacterium]
MNKIFLVLIFPLIIPISGFAQETEMTDSARTDPVLLGQATRMEIQQGAFGQDFMAEYATYEPCNETLNKLKNVIYNSHITIVMATWCYDSQMQVPRFYKILDRLDYKTDEIKLICVDRDKLAGNFDIQSLSIEYVPTFIFYKDQKEVGRIVESPENSLEKDSYQILSK